MFKADIMIGGVACPCDFKVLTDDGNGLGTVQLGSGTTRAVDVGVSGSVVLPEHVSYGGTVYTVTKLGDSCFAMCASITTTGLAGNTTITELGDRCFQACIALTDTGLGGNATVLTIGDFCFQILPVLVTTGLATNASVSSLGMGCFEGAVKLLSTGLGTNASVLSLGAGCFANCTHLVDTGLLTNSTITSLEVACFQGCFSLQSTGMETNVTIASIGHNCFQGCTALVNAAIGAGVTSIDDIANGLFNACTSLGSVCFMGGYCGKITLPNPCVVYYRAANHTWDGVVASGVSDNCSSLLSLSRLIITDGSVTSSPSNPWSGAAPGATYWAQGEVATVAAGDRIGYGFVGWATSDIGGAFDDETLPVTTYTVGPSKGIDATTLVANFVQNAYMVTFDPNYGVGTMNDQLLVYDQPEVLDANLFWRVGYDFLGWGMKPTDTVALYTDAQVVMNLATEEAATVRLYALWTERDTVLTFTSADTTMGTVSPSTQTVKTLTGSVVDVTATPKVGYHFVDWEIDETPPIQAGALEPSGVTGMTVVTIDPVLTADLIQQYAYQYGLWRKDTFIATFAINGYTIAYDANGGSGTMAPQSLTYNLAQKLNPNLFVRAGYAFDSWNTKSDGTGFKFFDAVTVKNLSAVNGDVYTLYAQWKPSSSGGNPDTGKTPVTPDKLPRTGDPMTVAVVLAAIVLAVGSVLLIVARRKRD